MPDTRRALLDLLAVRSGLSQGELADRTGVSTRTARRHLTALVEEGTVVASADGPARRYRLADHAQPVAPAPPLTDPEMEALSVAALAARPLLAPTPLAAALDAAAAKLRRAWLAEAFSFEPDTDPALWSFDGAAGGQSPDADAVLFRDLLTAVREQNPIRADYYTASRDTLTTRRRLAPLGFLVRGGAWLVAAADLDAEPDADGRPPVKDFALAGFRAVERLDGEHAAPPEGFDLALYARDRFGALDGEVEEVRLLVEPEAVPAFKRKLYNPTQQIEEEREDGRAVVSFEAGGMDAVKAWCLSWGPKVRVLAPASLAEQVAKTHREAARGYEDE
jgi:predicted DNA-binding transcriptional regulator YafY